VRVNAHALGRYAALCQEAGIVPIVEPEVLMDGDHSIDSSEAATRATLHAVFGELLEQRVALEGIVLKPNMVLSGTDCSDQAGVDEVAERTLALLRQVVPAAVPGIAFLSGGQSDESASAHLSALNALGPAPWELSFSYGRALQAAPLGAWGGEESNADQTQAAFAPGLAATARRVLAATPTSSSRHSRRERARGVHRRRLHAGRDPADRGRGDHRRSAGHLDDRHGPGRRLSAGPLHRLCRGCQAPAGAGPAAGGRTSLSPDRGL